MSDISHYDKKNSKNDTPDLAEIVITALARCSDNQTRFVVKPVKTIRFGYYRYDFESEKDVILDNGGSE